MRRQVLFALMALALVALASAGAFAYNGTTDEFGTRVTEPCPPTAVGAGPAATCVPADTTCTIWNTCNPDTAAKVCGTFCEAGQQPAGWPYGWCDQYWLRPDSNF